jgi:hypothetical protein
VHRFKLGSRYNPTFYYVRWNIETGYRYFKELLGFDQYQLRQEYFGQIIVYVYQQALEKKPLFDILKHLRIPA